MKVEFIDGVRGNSGALRDSAPWVDVGKIYVVLMINIMYSGEVSFRIFSEKERLPILMSSKAFRVVDGRVPADWILVELPLGAGYALSTPTFLEPGFWEAVFDQSKDAQVRFLREYKRITSESL